MFENETGGTLSLADGRLAIGRRTRQERSNRPTSAIGSLAAGLLPDRPAFGGQVTNWVEIGHWPRAAELLFSEGVEVGSLGSLGCMSRLRPS